MKVRENALVIVAVVLLGGMLWNGWTLGETEQVQKDVRLEYKIAKQYALTVKEKVEERREECRENGEWKDKKECESIREIYPKAAELWTKLQELDKQLQRADNKADEIQEKLKKIQRYKEIAVTVADKVGI